MGIEIERKYLINKDKWQPKDEGVSIRQGYLCTYKERTVRVRTKGKKAYLTIKGENKGISRMEMEYEIRLADAATLLDTMCQKPLIEKIRYVEPHLGHTWEIDVFYGDNDGLVVAEVELASVDEPVELPEWITREVSDDKRYYNACLSKNPFKNW